MPYIIYTTIRNIKYYVRITNFELGRYQLEGLRNNADYFHNKGEAEEAITKLRPNLGFEILKK